MASRLLSARTFGSAYRKALSATPSLSLASNGGGNIGAFYGVEPAPAPVASTLYQRTAFSSTSNGGENKIVAPPMVYIAGEEMTHYAMTLVVEQWVKPYFNTEKWEYFDLSCKARDESDDRVLEEAVKAGKRIAAIFKEPTITPSAQQVEKMGLSKAFGSPNGAMRKGWNGMTISRDTIHIDGIELGYKNRVLFERHAVGGEYGAGWKEVGKGTLLTTYVPDDGSDPFIVDKRVLTDDKNVAVVYHNPYDNIEGLAHYFFERCLEAKVTPYVVTKKTVFKWQEGFWATMKAIFDKDYKWKFAQAGLLKRSGGDLQHLISDAATMQLIRWTEGGFGMAAHNYDGDMLTDQIAQVHRSPGFITSNLIGKDDEGRIIKEYEASHGTVTDLWDAHLDGKPTSLNPLGLVEALIGAMNHAAIVQLEKDASTKAEHDKVMNFTTTLRLALHNTFRYGQGTQDMVGPAGYTTEAFIEKVGWRLGRYLTDQVEQMPPPELDEPRRSYDNIDMQSMQQLFDKYDSEGTGTVKLKDFTKMLIKMGVAPKTETYDKKPDV